MSGGLYEGGYTSSSFSSDYLNNISEDEFIGSCSKFIDTRYSVNDNLKAMFAIVGSLSIIACMFVTISIFSVTKLRAHPNGMIGFISLFEGISTFHTVIWAVQPMEYIQFFGLQNLFKMTMFIPPISTERESCLIL